MSTTSNRGPARLRVALWTWSGRDRRASGGVVVDTARDLIDAGGSVNREAFGVARAGLGLRLRGALRDARSAPWQGAAPLLLVAVSVLWVGLAVADVGGWQRAFGTTTGSAWTSYTPEPVDSGLVNWLNIHGAPLIPALSALLVGLALAGRRWLSVLTVGAIGIVLVAWTGHSPQAHLGQVNVLLERPDGRGTFGAQTGIAIYGVVGLLLVAAMLTALAWAITGSFTARRVAAIPRARPMRQSVLIAVGAVAITLVLPRLARWLDRGVNTVLGTGNVSSELWFGGSGSQTLWLLVFAILVIFALGLLLPRRAPSAALALTILSVTLLIPALWMFGGAFEAGVPFSWIVDEAVAVWLDWVLLVGLGLAVAARVTARAGVAQAARHHAVAPPSVETTPRPAGVDER